MGESEFTVRTTQVIAPAGTTALLGSDPRRVYVAFTATNTVSSSLIQAIGYGLVPATYTIGASSFGSTIPVTLEFWYHRHGPLPAAAWVINSPMNPATIVITELLSIGPTVITEMANGA